MHAQYLSASKPHWLNYDDDKFDYIYTTNRAAQRGSELHVFAAMAIRLGIKLRGDGTTLSRYVNESIGFRMRPEQPLVYSTNAFGTADAIAFRSRKLRISDLKTGAMAASFRQLKVYAAFFCLEYGENPFDIEIELRIYQNDDVRVERADPDEITRIMQKIKYLDRRIIEMRREEDES
jgi:hypothetical protein